jgi:glutamine synthetase
MNVREALEFAKKNRVQVVDLKFVDLIGTWQHFTIPASELTEDLFKDGSGLDGSSIRGWKAINNSDMLVVPDPATTCLDPFTAVPTLSLIGNVVDPISRETYERDPRYIAQKAERYLQSTKIGDTSYWGPEAEFFIMRDTTRRATAATTTLIPKKACGTWARTASISAGRSVIRKATFPCRPPIRSRTSAAK